MTITTEQAEQLAMAAEMVNRPATAEVFRSLAAERDALRAERNAEVGHRLKAEGALFNMERRIARQRRALAKLYAKRHDRKVEREQLQAENARLREALHEIECSHIPDQPAAFEHSDLDWARLHVGKIRSIARAALGETQ
jgi:hypothetical protein